jgi:creatinine amidohydrolase
MPPRPYVLAELTWPIPVEARYEVAVLPWGATEAHNRHLPYATDTNHTEWVAIESARRAWEAVGRVMVLPVIPFGVQTGQLDIPFCINMNPSTQAAFLRDIAQSLERHGVGKLVVLNGHGGNDFRQIIREVQPSFRMLLCQANWYASVKASDYFDDTGDHAGELETSVMLHLQPAQVRPLAEAGSGHARVPRVQGFREGWAWTPRQWSRVTDDTGVGDPRGATAEKGERFLSAAVEQVTRLLTELVAVDRDNLYE